MPYTYPMGWTKNWTPNCKYYYINSFFSTWFNQIIRVNRELLLKNKQYGASDLQQWQIKNKIVVREFKLMLVCNSWESSCFNNSPLYIECNCDEEFRRIEYDKTNKLRESYKWHAQKLIDCMPTSIITYLRGETKYLCRY